MSVYSETTVGICLCILFTLSGVIAQNVSITIPLNNSVTFADKELYGDYFFLNRSTTLLINLEAPSKNVSFIVFQVHSHLYNIILYNNSYTKGSFVNSTNAALYGNIKPTLDKYYIWNQYDIDLKIYISIHAYGPKDPIPGGCNMEFPQPIAPYLRTQYTKDYIYVDAGSARDPTDNDCLSMTDTYVVFYRIYLAERDFSEDTYFSNLKTMLTLENIEEVGHEIPADTTWTMRRMLSAYPGTGSIYVAVAYSSLSKAYSVYAPTYTYACSPVDDDCDLIDDFLSQFLCASLLFIGIFICFFGHKFFKTEMYLSGLLTGYLVTNIMISVISNLQTPELTVVSALCGIFFGAIWLLFWWFYGMPLFSVLLPTLNLGFLFAAIVYYQLPGGLTLLQTDYNFWPVFIMIMLLTSLFFISITFLTNILCCAVLGGYAAVYPIDYYLGSNLKYIVINIVRRATVPKFGRAVIAPVFQKLDAILTFIWIALSLTGFIYQHYQNRNRPPFPPPPRSISRRMPDDTRVQARGRSKRYGTTGSVISSSPNSSAYLTPNEATPLLT